MTHFTEADIIDEKGGKIFDSSLSPQFFLLNAFDRPAGKDRYPDIDGQIRLRDGVKEYLNCYLHYQLKSTTKIKNGKFPCPGNVLDYLLSTNVPTLYIVVDVKNGNAYWFFLDEEQKKKYGLKEKGNKGVTIDLTSQLITPNGGLALSNQWQSFAKEDDYEALSNSLSRITTSLHRDIQKYLGLLFLLQRIQRKDLIEYFNKILKIENSEIDLITKKLVQEGVISATENYYLLDNERLGIESLHKLLDDFDPTILESLFSEDDKKTILKQLASVEHPLAVNYLKKLAKETVVASQRIENNDDFNLKLSLFHQFAFRFPSATLKIVRNLIKSKPIPAATIDSEVFGSMKGKTSDDLLIKLIEIIETIRYSHSDFFIVLVDIVREGDQKVRSKAEKVLEHLSKYNLHALKRFGYSVQLTILDKIEQWGDDKMAKNLDALTTVSKELLGSQYEGTSMQDEKTMVFHSGSVDPSSELKSIRERTLKILQKAYNLTQDLAKQKELIKTMEEASRPPHSAGYGEDMEQTITENVNQLIDFYLSILPEANNQIVKEVEEQTHWFSKRFKKENLPRLEELKERIAGKEEYEMFKVFVGYDGGYNEDSDWQKAQEERNEKIQQFVADVTVSNFQDWEKKILDVARTYLASDTGEFQYFNSFLFEFSKQKPEMAITLLSRLELQPFLIHIIAGLWKSELQSEARKVIEQWTKEGRYLVVSARLFDYVEEANEQLLVQVFQKAQELKDLDAINSVVTSITRTYNKQKWLKTLFLKGVDELSKNSNFWWVNSIGYRGEAILEDLTEEEFDHLLENMLLLPNIDDYAENILAPVAGKYPGKVINFFETRVEIKSRKDTSWDERFEAIPYNIKTLGEALKLHEIIIVPMLLSWYGKGSKKGRWLFEWEASQFLQEIFPNFSEVLERALKKIISNGQKDALEIAFSILSKYEVETNLWEIIKAIVFEYSKSKKYEKIKNILFGLLSQTGTVSGEYGFVHALEKKQKAIPELKSGESQQFQDFINEYRVYLDKKIVYEKKRADEDIELMKRSI